MAGVAAFMIVSSVYKIPVSATHAIVGASLASSLYLRGNVGIKWMEIGGIGERSDTEKHSLLRATLVTILVLSWFISPLIAGFFASAFYLIIKYSVLLRKDTFKWALLMCPVFMCFTITVNLFACIFDGSKCRFFYRRLWWCQMYFLLITVFLFLLFSLSISYSLKFIIPWLIIDLGFDRLSWWQAGLISLGAGLLAMILLSCPLKVKSMLSPSPHQWLEKSFLKNE